MTRRLVILGTGGNAFDILDVVEAINRSGPTWEVAGFLADNPSPDGHYLGLPVIGPLSAAARLAETWFVNAIGSDASYRAGPSCWPAPAWQPTDLPSWFTRRLKCPREHLSVRGRTCARGR